MTRIIGLAAMIFLLMNNSTYGNNLEDNPKEGDIAKLIKLIDPANQGVKWLKELFLDLTKVDGSEHERLLEEINTNTVVALYHPLYNKYFTHEEIRELISFYSTEYGAKMARTKSDIFGKQVFTPDEMEKIKEFKETEVGKKYEKLSDKISKKHSKLATKFVDSLR